MYIICGQIDRNRIKEGNKLLLIVQNALVSCQCLDLEGALEKQISADFILNGRKKITNRQSQLRFQLRECRMRETHTMSLFPAGLLRQLERGYVCSQFVQKWEEHRPGQSR